MNTAMQIVQIIFQVVGILCMLTFMFIGIWSFVLFNKMYKNQRIHNYLLQKINNSILSLEVLAKESHSYKEESQDLDFDFKEDFLKEEPTQFNDKVIRIDEA